MLRLYAGGLATAKQEITNAKHTLESSAKTLMTPVALRRHSWLQSTNLPFNTRDFIEDLQFDETGLFHSMMDTRMQDLDKSAKALRTLEESATLRSPVEMRIQWNLRPFQYLAIT